MTKLATISLTATLMMSGAALAHQPAPYGYYPPYQAKAATAGESWARGMSDVVRSAGETNLRNSEAAKNYEQARSANFDNQLKYVDVYFQKQIANREYRKKLAPPKPTREQMYRWAAEARPETLSATQLDPVTGEINWPMALRSPEFAQQTKLIEKLFEERARAGNGAPPQVSYQIKSACESLTDALKDQIRSIPPNQYMSAKNFIKSLSYKATYSTS